MIVDRYLHLMDTEIDGLNSPEDSRLLAAYLQANDEARCYYRGMRGAVAMLENSALSEPPPGLRQSILTATSATTGAGASGLRAVGQRLLRRPGYAYAFAAGLVMGLVLLGAVWPRLQREWNPPLRDLYGAAAPDASTVRDFIVDQAGVKGRVRFGFTAERVTVRVDLASDGAARLDLTHAEGLVVEDLRVLGPAAPDMVVGPGRLALEHSGRGIYEIVFRGDVSAQSAFAIALRLDGNLLIERVIEPE